MPTAATIYSETIRPLPPEERLRIAALILQDLTGYVVNGRTEEEVSFITLPPPPATAKILSPRLADPTDASRIVKQIIEDMDDAGL